MVRAVDKADAMLSLSSAL